MGIYSHPMAQIPQRVFRIGGRNWSGENMLIPLLRSHPGFIHRESLLIIWGVLFLNIDIT